MNNIAIYFEKFNLGNNKFIFKPINVIKGSYDEDDNEFVTDYGVVCDSINVSSLDAEDYFDYPTTIDELKKSFGEQLPEEVLLTEYFNISLNYCYISYYDIGKDKMVVKRISFEEVEKVSESDTIIEVSNESLSSSKFIFSLDGINDLKNSEDISEVRKKLDVLIEINNKYSSAPKEKVSMGSSTSLAKLSNQLISLKELRKEVLSNIIGQDKAVMDLTRTIMINQTSLNPRNKSHMLVTGPSGTGKTEIVRIICENLGLPFFEADATAYTKEGYEGKSVYSMLCGLLSAADDDIEKAQNGILVIDEIDKKLSSKDDVSGVAVMQALYKIMDRGIIELDMGMPGERDTILFDTSNLTIILMGAFEELYKKKLNDNKNSIGFGSSKIEIPKKEIILTKDDLHKAGMPSEFLGRVDELTSTKFFDINDLVKILNESKRSALRIQKEYFYQAFGVNLETSDDYSIEVASRAIKAKTNARELKPIVKDTLKYATEEFLAGRKGKVLKITRETVLDPRKYYVE